MNSCYLCCDFHLADVKATKMSIEWGGGFTFQWVYLEPCPLEPRRLGATPAEHTREAIPTETVMVVNLGYITFMSPQDVECKDAPLQQSQIYSG